MVAVVCSGVRIDKTDRRAFVRNLLAWGRKNRRSFPWRETSDPFEVLVAEVLLRRSRAGTVARVHRHLFDRWPEAPDLAGAEAPEVEDVIRPAGLVSRAEGLVRLATQVVERGGVPNTRDGLLELHGVGEYTAAATLQVVFAKRVASVDAVSARVYRRFFGETDVEHKAVDDELWALVEEVMPRRAVREWNWAVLDLAAEVCVPRNPRCGECPLDARCAYAEELRSSQRSG